MEDKLLKIITHYGVISQLKYFQSEIFELNEAIFEYEKASEWTSSMVENWKKHIAEEISDVCVMLEQFRLYYGISVEEISDIMQYKIDRQIKRIEDEKNVR